MRLGKEEAVGYVEDTLEDTPAVTTPVLNTPVLNTPAVTTPLVNSEASPLTVAEIRADQPQQPLTPAAEPLRAG